MTLDDLTSGFNIGTNYYLSYGFNEMVGFTEKEVREMLTYYSQQYDLRQFQSDSCQNPHLSDEGQMGISVVYASLDENPLHIESGRLIGAVS